jgi:Xaa-Pro aminopeptidase
MSADVPLKKGDLVLIDIGVTVDHYRSDMTRVVFYQEADPELERLYQINKEAQGAALQECRPGTRLGALDRAARAVMQTHGVEPLFVHSLGHGIGLETHEYPRLKWDNEDKDLVLEPGMVFTVEPGLYIPEKGGVRYEDTIRITEDGYVNFYPDSGDKAIILR